jgi:hypothetical protein
MSEGMQCDRGSGLSLTRAFQCLWDSRSPFWCNTSNSEPFGFRPHAPSPLAQLHVWLRGEVGRIGVYGMQAYGLSNVRSCFRHILTEGLIGVLIDWRDCRTDDRCWMQLDQMIYMPPMLDDSMALASKQDILRGALSTSSVAFVTGRLIAQKVAGLSHSALAHLRSESL